MEEINGIKVIRNEELFKEFGESFAYAVISYIELVSHLWNRKYNSDNPNQFFVVAGGRKYVKIANVTARWAHSFIDISTGDIYKVATWATPAKGVRGNIYTNNGMDALTERGQVRYLN